MLGLTLVAVAACQTEAERNFRLAEAARIEGEDLEAAGLYRDVTLTEPRGELAARAHLELARIYYLRARDVDAAFASLRVVVSDFPESSVVAPARQLLGRIYEEELGDPGSAIRQYEELLKRPVEETEIRRAAELALAECHYRLDHFDEAASAYRSVLRHLRDDDEMETAYLRLAHVELLRGFEEEALRVLEELLARTDDDEYRHRAYLARLDLYLRLDRFDDAREILAMAREEFPESDDLETLSARLQEHWEGQLSFEGEDEVHVLEELQKKIRWGAGRRQRRNES